ncbi:MAG: GumC family protein [Planctomycetota bacterium]
MSKIEHSSFPQLSQPSAAPSATSRVDTPQPDEERSFAEIRRILQDVLRILALHPWAFFLPFCLATSIAFVVSLYSPRSYSATASFERRDDPVALSLDISSGAASFKFFRKTMVDDLKSVTYMAEVVDNLGLTKDFERDANGNLTPASKRRRNGLARSLAGRITISSRSPGEFVDHVTIRYTGADPTIGRKLVEETRNTYIRRSREWIRQHLVAQRDYFQQQLAGFQAELVAARRAATKFRLDHPLVDPSDPGAINVKLTQLENESRFLQLRKQELEADLLMQQQVLVSLGAASADSLNSSLGAGNNAGQEAPSSAEALAIIGQVQAIERKITELRSARGMTAQHPEIVELASKRDYYQDELTRQQEWDAENGPQVNPDAAETSVALMGRVASLPAQIDRAMAVGRVSTIEGKIRDVETHLSKNAEMIGELHEAKRNVFANQEEFAIVRDRVTRARREHSKMEATLSRILPAIEATDQDRLVKFTAGAPAHGSVLPISPSAKNVVLLSLVFGVAAGVLFVILAEILDHVYRSSSQVARSLGMPILDSIDEIITTHDRRRILVKRLVVVPLVLGGGIMVTGLSGAMAFLSLTKPTAYEKVRRIPNAALRFFAGDLSRPSDHLLPPDGGDQKSSTTSQESVGPVTQVPEEPKPAMTASRLSEAPELAFKSRLGVNARLSLHDRSLDDESAPVDPVKPAEPD